VYGARRLTGRRQLVIGVLQRRERQAQQVANGVDHSG
jgi:heme exporter protein D